MDLVLQFVAIIAFITGALLVFAPKLLIKISEFLNQSYDTDKVVFLQRKTFGSIFVLLGLVYIWVIW